MNEVTSLAQLVAIARKLRPRRCVGVEGFCGSGKTDLARRLARELLAECVSTDDFVTKKDSNLYYPDVLDLAHFTAALQKIEKRNRLIIVEGICLRDIAERIGLRVRSYIYVKAVSETGMWHGRFHLEDFEGSGARSQGLEEPHLSDLRYHSKARPHEKADIVFVRQEG